jgi:hypothetical protein
MAIPAFDVSKITDEIKINPRWRTVKIFQEIIKLRKIGKGDLHIILKVL